MTPAGSPTSFERADGLLTVNVPEDAKIYVNGIPTSSTGGARQYVSRNLRLGFNYTYEVKAEMVRDGKPVEVVKTINLRAGETANLAFDMEGSQPAETSLTVRVPAEAKVYLAGNPTKATGELRVFKTTGLSSGNAWDDYTIRVDLEQDGRVITQERTIKLVGGKSEELTFEFDVEKVASR